MTRALVSEIQTFIEVYKDDLYENEITNIFVYQDLNIEFVEDENFNFFNERWFVQLIEH